MKELSDFTYHTPGYKMAKKLQCFDVVMSEIEGRFFNSTFPFTRDDIANIAFHLDFKSCLYRVGTHPYPLDLGSMK